MKNYIKITIASLVFLAMASCGTAWTVSVNPKGEIIIEAAKGSGPITIPVVNPQK